MLQCTSEGLQGKKGVEVGQEEVSQTEDLFDGHCGLLTQTARVLLKRLQFAGQLAGLALHLGYHVFSVVVPAEGVERSQLVPSGVSNVCCQLVIHEVLSSFWMIPDLIHISGLVMLAKPQISAPTMGIPNWLN